MPPLNPISAKLLLRLLQQYGFEIMRVQGSHHFLYNSKTRKTTVVPVHANEDVGIGLLRKILRDIGRDVEYFNKIR